MAEDIKKAAAKHREGENLPDKATFDQYRARYENLETQSSNVSQDRKELLEEAEGKGLHKKAFKDAIKLKKDNEGSAASYLAHFDLYCEHLGLRAQGDLFEKEGDEKNKKAKGETAVEEAKRIASGQGNGAGSKAGAHAAE